MQSPVVSSCLLVDFFPVRVGRLLEPLLNLMGVGRFHIRPSAFCGFATVLVSTSEHKVRSLPPVSLVLSSYS